MHLMVMRAKKTGVREQLFLILKTIALWPLFTLSAERFVRNCSTKLNKLFNIGNLLIVFP